MIRTITVRNFQSHRNTTLELSPGVNVIVGVSDSGKSALLRAMNWLINNRPSGDIFRSKWGGDTSVSFTMDDGTVVERIRTKTLNCYRIGDMVLEAMKTEVPQEVRDILNMHDVNIQKQFDSPFLLSENSGEVARYLNEITRLDKIDTALSTIAGIERRNNDKLKDQQNILTNLTTNLKEYEHLGEAEKEVERMEKLDKELTGLRDARNNLDSLLASIDQELAEQNRIQGVLDIGPEVALLLGIATEVRGLKGRRDQLNGMGSAISGHLKTVRCLDEGPLAIEGEMLELMAANKTIDEQVGDNSRLADLIVGVEKAERKVDTASVRLQQAIKEFNQKMPDICPLCGFYRDRTTIGGQHA